MRRTCTHGVAQWEQIAEQTRKGLDEMNRNAAGGAKHSMDYRGHGRDGRHLTIDI